MDKALKKQLRLELHALLLLDDHWFEKPETVLFDQITTIGECLGNEPFKWKKRNIDKEQYLNYIQKGYTFSEIAHKFNVSTNTLRLWRQDNHFL